MRHAEKGEEAHRSRRRRAQGQTRSRPDYQNSTVFSNSTRPVRKPCFASRSSISIYASGLPRLSSCVRSFPKAMDALTKKPAKTGPAPAGKIERPSREAAEAAVRTLIAWVGDDPSREGLIDTPRRVLSAYEEFYAGYGQDPAEALERT